MAIQMKIRRTAQGAANSDNGNTNITATRIMFPSRAASAFVVRMLFR